MAASLIDTMRMRKGHRVKKVRCSKPMKWSSYCSSSISEGSTVTDQSPARASEDLVREKVRRRPPGLRYCIGVDTRESVEESGCLCEHRRYNSILQLEKSGSCRGVRFIWMSIGTCYQVRGKTSPFSYLVLHPFHLSLVCLFFLSIQPMCDTVFEIVFSRPALYEVTACWWSASVRISTLKWWCSHRTASAITTTLQHWTNCQRWWMDVVLAM